LIDYTLKLNPQKFGETFFEKGKCEYALLANANTHFALALAVFI
jgi:hypothetical protein